MKIKTRLGVAGELPQGEVLVLAVDERNQPHLEAFVSKDVQEGVYNIEGVEPREVDFKEAPESLREKIIQMLRTHQYDTPREWLN